MIKFKFTDIHKLLPRGYYSTPYILNQIIIDNPFLFDRIFYGDNFGKEKA